MEVYGVVYLLIDGTNDMEYVGQTTKTAEKRFREHTKSDCYIGRAIRAHGEENFVIAILKDCYSKEELDRWEKHFIRSRNTKCPNGYNMTDGGEGSIGLKFTPEQLARLSEAHKGHRHTEEQKAKISLALTGKKKSPEHCKKMSVVQSGEKNYFFGKYCTEEERMKKSILYRRESPYKNLITELNTHNLTYTALAKLSGLSIANISRKMGGIRNFTPKEMVMIKNILGVDMSVEELFRRFDD